MAYRSDSRQQIRPATRGQTSQSVQAECPFCAETISPRAKKCRHCHETLDPAMRKAEEALRTAERQGGNVYMNSSVAAPPPPAPPPQIWERKSRGTAVLLALLLGGFGVHKFYLGRTWWGLLYLIFCWTFVPAVIAALEAIVYLFSSDTAFQRKYAVMLHPTF